MLMGGIVSWANVNAKDFYEDFCDCSKDVFNFKAMQIQLPSAKVVRSALYFAGRGYMPRSPLAQ
jgi:hypothetical protein